MQDNTGGILIIPVKFSNTSTPSKSRKDSIEHKASFHGFYKFSPELFEQNPRILLKTVYLTIFSLTFLNNGPRLDFSDTLNHVTMALLRENMWVWDLETIIKRNLDYFEKFMKLSGPSFKKIRKEMTENIKPYLTAAGMFSPLLVDTIIEQITKEFEAGGKKTSIEEIASRLQKNPILNKLPNEVIDKCIDEFFDILFTKGYISFSGE